MDSLTMGVLIKEFREARNMTQTELAERLGVSDKAVSKWETGKGYPDITLMEPLAGALGVSVTELMAGTPVQNQNRGFNMNRCVFYVCPVCGNVIVSTGEAVVCCHGMMLVPQTAKAPDDGHGITVEPVEDEYFVRMEHAMEKDHFVSFLAAVTDSGVTLQKLYPEGNPEARFKINRTRAIYGYCNRHGLFRILLHNGKVVSPMKKDIYAEEAKEKYGSTPAYRESERRRQDRTPRQQEEIADGMMELFGRFGQLKDGDPAAPAAQELVRALQAYITEHYYSCTLPILRGLGEIYASDERFRQTIDAAGGAGTADFAARAIASYPG